MTTDVTKAVDKAKDTVVGITNIQETMNFFGSEATTQEAGTGSGVIYKKDGDKAFIVTNYHVIEGSQQLEVPLADGTKEPAELIGGCVDILLSYRSAVKMSRKQLNLATRKH